MKYKSIFLLVIIGSILSVGFYLYKNNEVETDEITLPAVDSLSHETTYEPTYLYGFIVDSLVVIEEKIRPNQSLSDILLPHNISHPVIFELAEKSKPVFDVRKINAGKPYTLICADDSLQTIKKFIYEPNREEYIILHMDDSIFAEKFERKLTFVEKMLEGTIESSLSQTMDNIGGSAQLTNEFVDVFAWQVDFFSLQKGDRFRVLYTEKQIEGEAVGIEGISAIFFEHIGTPLYAFAYDQGEGIDYFDENGKSIRKALLRYPLEFSRISSRYSLNRYHPVQKRYKAHLGTDFAAPTGTPIRSVGAGNIVEAGYSSGNGNYVKVKHNATYTTQYLHMSKIASGIRAGVRVAQGQTIGYVGSTGLATGPHLCYRFWKNGVQVDALAVKLPPAEPLKEENMGAFEEVRLEFMKKLLMMDSVNSTTETLTDELAVE